MKEFIFDATQLRVGSLYSLDEKVIKVHHLSDALVKIAVVDGFGSLYTIEGTMEHIKSRLKPDNDKPIKHEKFDMVCTIMREGMSVYLYGAAGTGKNVLCQQVAEELGLKFYFANSVQDRFDLLGYGDANGKFVETEFYRAFTQGGLFMLDEMDNSCEDALITLNAALANKYIAFPIIGRVEAHKDFKVIAAGNTCGKGANELYTGRRPLDAATLNRFEFLEVGYDKRIEKKISNGDTALVNFVHDLRKSSKATGYPVVVSYRNINSITKLKKHFSMKDCMKMCLFKGMQSDEIAVLHRGLSDKRNEYAQVLEQLMNEED